MARSLPLPELSRHTFGGVTLLTDNVLFGHVGVRMGFTERSGGVSTGAFESLNLGAHVGDDPEAVSANRRLLLDALGAPGARLIVPNQVHGTELVHVGRPYGPTFEQIEQQAAQGADGVIVSCTDVAALLCFADCMPVVIVAPAGAFAVVHAGWRGVFGRIAPRALVALCDAVGAQPADCNVYLGPYIHGECFEVSPDLAQKFEAEFGPDCVPDSRHVDLGAAMRASLHMAGADLARVADAGACTVCGNDRFFSYRAQDGVCGRHGAVAVRVSR